MNTMELITTTAYDIGATVTYGQYAKLNSAGGVL